MPDTSVGASDLSSLQTDLLQKLEALGGYAGNVTLQRQLNWNDDKYWKTRDSLVDAGVLQRGRGRGGSVLLIADSVPSAVAPPASGVPVPPKPTEADLYEPVSHVIADNWARDNRYRQSLVEITAKQGKKLTGGTWTRPDIVLAALRVFQYVPGRHFDVITFEVKPWWAVDVTAGYEALAHRRAATQPFVWFHIPAEGREPLDQTIEAISMEAKRHGVGVIIASEARDYETWETVIDAERFVPDPESLNEFITLQLSADAKQDILAWTK